MDGDKKILILARTLTILVLGAFFVILYFSDIYSIGVNTRIGFLIQNGTNVITAKVPKGRYKFYFSNDPYRFQPGAEHKEIRKFIKSILITSRSSVLNSNNFDFFNLHGYFEVSNDFSPVRIEIITENIQTNQIFIHIGKYVDPI